MRSFASAEGREAKAAKINAVLGAALTHSPSGLDILDLGSGSGHIAAYLAQANRVTAADIENQLQASSPNLRFVALTGTTLPFDNAHFDIVIVNFVLMYIADPLATLREIRRVLRPGGVCYVSLPNRCFPVDPHLHWPLISWLPAHAYQVLVNKLRKTDEHIRLFSPRRAAALFAQAGFGYQDFTTHILHAPRYFHVKLPFKLPDWSWLTFLSPSNIFVLTAPRIS